MRPDNEEVRRFLLGRPRDAGERIGKHDTDLAGDPIDILHRALQLPEKYGGRVAFVVDNALRLVVVDDMNNRQGGVELLGEQGRAPERAIRPLGEVGGQHDLLHVVLLVAVPIMTFSINHAETDFHLIQII